MTFLNNKIIIPLSDFLIKHIKQSLKKVISRKQEKAMITKRELVELLIDWKKDKEPSGVEVVGATDYYRYVCEELGLVEEIDNN